MNFINNRKLKLYTKEVMKIFNIALLAFGLIIAIILIKYKPMYEVKVSGEKVGYLDNKNNLCDMIEENITNYNGKNIDKVELTEEPEYKLKLVEKGTESDNSEILVALQEDVEITYKYYEIKKENEILEKVDTLEIAEQLVDELEELENKGLSLEIEEKTTKEENELNTNIIETAKENMIEELNIDTKHAITDINGIKISTLPLSGNISSRYGESSGIRRASHTGLDISVAKGTPIKAISNGIVTFAGKKGSYGNLVKIDHGNGVESWYAHASKINVEKGETVKSGDVIALVGSTGNSTGPHLHLEIRINGKHVNPQKYLYN